MNLLCLIGRHERSRGQAHYDQAADQFVSRCRHCGKAMHKTRAGAWVSGAARAEDRLKRLSDTPS